MHSWKESTGCINCNSCQVYKLDNKIGKLDKGYLANFLITSGQIFDDKTEINENWVKGQRHVVKNTRQYKHGWWIPLK